MDSFPWLILFAIVVIGLVVYLMFMVFLPEWVGITGKTAIENEKAHRADHVEQKSTDTAVDTSVDTSTDETPKP